MLQYKLWNSITPTSHSDLTSNSSDAPPVFRVLPSHEGAPPMATPLQPCFVQRIPRVHLVVDHNFPMKNYVCYCILKYICNYTICIYDCIFYTSMTWFAIWGFFRWPPLSKSTLVTLVLLAVNCWSTSGPGIWGFCHILSSAAILMPQKQTSHNTNAIFIPILPGCLHFGIWDFALVIFGETSKGPLTLLQLNQQPLPCINIISLVHKTLCIHLYHVVIINF